MLYLTEELGGNGAHWISPKMKTLTKKAVMITIMISMMIIMTMITMKLTMIHQIVIIISTMMIKVNTPLSNKKKNYHMSLKAVQ